MGEKEVWAGLKEEAALLRKMAYNGYRCAPGVNKVK
jgi:hypothetical protein